jgi:hypothetical protein
MRGIHPPVFFDWFRPPKKVSVHTQNPTNLPLPLLLLAVIVLLGVYHHSLSFLPTTNNHLLLKRKPKYYWHHPRSIKTNATRNCSFTVQFLLTEDKLQCSQSNYFTSEFCCW